MEVDPKWLKRHENGWELFYANKPVARLKFLNTNQPVHKFSVSPLIPVEQLRVILISLSDWTRDEDIGCYLENLSSEHRIKDMEFLLSWNQVDNTLTIKDLSQPEFLPEKMRKPSGLFGKLARLFKS